MMTPFILLASVAAELTKAYLRANSPKVVAPAAG